MEHDRLLKKKLSEVEQLNSTSVRLREDKIRMESQLQDVTMKHNTLTAQCTSLKQQLTDAEEQHSQLQTLLDESERKSTDLASQLSMALAKQQQQLRLEKETRTALDRAKLEKLRMERELQVREKGFDHGIISNTRVADFETYS